MYREIDIKQYVPPVVKDTIEFKEIAKVENPELNLVNGFINNAFEDQFVKDSNIYGVKRWEKMLKIYPNESDDLDMRKFRILLRLNRKIPYTYRVLENQLKTLFGEDNYNINLKHEIYELSVSIKTYNYKMFNEVMNEIEEIIPCNLVLNCIMESDFNSELKLETKTKEYPYPWYMCGTFLCGTKPDINNLGTKVTTELSTVTNNKNTKQKYPIAGTFESGGDTI